MKLRYECQICKQLIDNEPPEHCPRCGGHKIIFKRLSFAEMQVILLKDG